MDLKMIVKTVKSESYHLTGIFAMELPAKNIYTYRLIDTNWTTMNTSRYQE
jgi:hypothetical protein